MSQIKLYTPHDKQKLIHSACSLSDPCFYVIAVAGRRAGKSMAAINQVIFWSLKYPGCKIWYVTPTDSQSEVVLTEIMNGLKDSNLIKSKRSSKGSREILFKNGTSLMFKSASAGGNLRGSDINFTIIDEAAYLNNKTFEADIMPSMAVGGKKCLIISTPKGKNWFYKYYLKGLDKTQKDFKSFKFLSTDNPKANTKLIEMFRQSVPEGVFAQEYLGSFEDSASVFRNIEQVCVLQPANAPEPGMSYYVGVDIGLISDETVITVINSRGEVCMVDRFTQVEAPELRERLLSHLRKWKPVRTLIEENNQGLVLLQDLKRSYANITGFKTTNQSKEEIINRLVAAFSGLEIKALNDDEMILQLNSFIFELTATGKIRYCAAQGFHDDIVMSLALAWNAFVSATKMGGYHVYVADKAIKKTSSLGKFMEHSADEEDQRWNGENNNEFIFFR